MKKRILPILLVLLILILVIALQKKDDGQLQSQLILPDPGDTTGFVRAEKPTAITFPADQGPHPDYLTEWWYYTGNLDTLDGQHFGFQLTFFRRALVPASERAENRTSDWAADQVYLAHFALTDASGKQFQSFERFSRGAADLAGAQADPYRVWLENWSVEAICSRNSVSSTDTNPAETPPDSVPCSNQTPSETPFLQYHLFAEQDSLRLDLTLTPSKDYTLHGDQGYSQKGPEPGNASYYISQTRLEAGGSAQTERGRFEVTGLVWMDHEYSTSALSDGQIGWDWFSVQLSDNTEVMFFQLRRDDGSIDPFSSGTVIYPDGTTRALTQEDFTITVQDTWRSPHSEADYPSQWQVNIPSENLTLDIQPWLADQELQTSVVYWEGAVRVEGAHNGQTITGNGYVEMTGYAEPFDGDF